MWFTAVEYDHGVALGGPVQVRQLSVKAARYDMIPRGRSRFGTWSRYSPVQMCGDVCASQRIVVSEGGHVPA